ncbi:hypothetical protein G7Y89_g14102 [Cudoniella acicularis]|uniref:BTB domain-containing protein n=1 Tax=Cudoniella acicularis TaxID=354080 RepID=A0A8H4VVD3_9HELO|nr:hypothetical protein G7Y89_g14102 [Cudoniella acicularis]
MENGKTTIELPKYSPGSMAAFVRWAYTGSLVVLGQNILDDPVYEEIGGYVFSCLWILGGKLSALKFTNDAVRNFMCGFENERISAGVAEYVYGNTTSASKLRLFVRDHLTTKSPFCDCECLDETERKEWAELLGKGGELVVECMFGGGLHNCADGASLTLPPFHSIYLEDIGGLTVKEWYNQKP